jgi:hypothetical protein
MNYLIGYEPPLGVRELMPDIVITALENLVRRRRP